MMHGADPNFVDIEGNKPIDLAHKQGHSKCVSFLNTQMKKFVQDHANSAAVRAETPVSTCVLFSWNRDPRYM